MALPSNSSPIYEVKIPSTEKVIKYRPFLVKEEKALLLAQESENVTTFIDTIKIVIQGCTMNQIDVDSLAVFDLEYLITQIRAKSVGEIVELVFKCDTCEDEKAKVQINIDLTKLEIEKNPKHKKTISLFDDVGIVMKYPSFSSLSSLQNETSDVDNYFKVIVDCIDYIYQGEVLFPTKEQSKEQLTEFINNLTRDQFLKVQEFFETQPKLKQEISYKCPVCSKEHTKTIEGLQSFF